MDSIWKEIKNFAELQECMVGYLTGKYSRNPWVCAGIDAETIPIVGSLVKINTLGFVTIVSQPGVTTIFPDGYSEYQRGFMTGYISKQKCDLFIEELLKIGKIIICKDELGTGKEATLYGDYESLVLSRRIRRENDMQIVHGTGRFINLTKEIIPEGDEWLEEISEKERKRLAKIGDKFIRYYTNRLLDYHWDETEVLVDVNDNLLKYLHENTYQLTVIRSEYGSADLDSIILDILSKMEGLNNDRFQQ